MPLTSKGNKIMAAMKAKYGEKKGEQVFYASKNAGTISGVDSFEEGKHPRASNGQFAEQAAHQSKKAEHAERTGNRAAAFHHRQAAKHYKAGNAEQAEKHSRSAERNYTKPEDAVRVSKDSAGHLHVVITGRQMGKLLASKDMAGTVRTVARGHRMVSVMRKDRKANMDGTWEIEYELKDDMGRKAIRTREVTAPSEVAALAQLKQGLPYRHYVGKIISMELISDHTRDMNPAKFERLKALLTEFLSEEEAEPEHNHDCNGTDSCDCGCKH